MNITTPDWLGPLLLVIGIGIIVWTAYMAWKGRHQVTDQTNSVVERPLATTSNILQIERQETSNRPPLWLSITGTVTSLLLLAFGLWVTYFVLSGIIIAKFNLEWIAFYLLFGVFPILLLIAPFTFDRKYYKSGRSAIAIDVTFVVSGDITDVFNKCSNILETMKAKIIRKNTPNLIKGGLNKSNISIEVSPSDDNVKVYVISDATWVTVKVGKERNQRIIDEFQKHFIDAFRVSKPDNVLWAKQSLILTPHTYAIGLSGIGDYPREPENAAWLLLEVFVNPIDKPIDTLDLIIEGKPPIPANYWQGKNVTAFNVYFNVTEWQWKGKNQVELIAKVGGAISSSGRIPIDFNVEPFGRHLI